MNGFYSVCYLVEDDDDYPTIYHECDELLEALESGEELMRRPEPYEVWVEIGGMRFALVKFGRPCKWDASLVHIEKQPDGSERSFSGGPENCYLWTRRKLARFWGEVESGEHKAAFPCAWDECDGYSRDLVPLMRDRYGILYQCRKCLQWTDSDCSPESPTRPYRATRESALARLAAEG